MTTTTHALPTPLGEHATATADNVDMRRSDTARTSSTADDTPFNSRLATPADEDDLFLFSLYHSPLLGQDPTTPKPAQYSPVLLDEDDLNEALPKNESDSVMTGSNEPGKAGKPKMPLHKSLSKAVLKAKSFARGLTASGTWVAKNSEPTSAVVELSQDIKSERYTSNTGDVNKALSPSISVSAVVSATSDSTPQQTFSALGLESTASVSSLSQYSQDDGGDDEDVSSTLATRDTFESLVDYLAGTMPARHARENARHEICMERINTTGAEENIPCSSYTTSPSVSSIPSSPRSPAYDADADDDSQGDLIVFQTPEIHSVDMEPSQTSLSALVHSMDPMRQTIFSSSFAKKSVVDLDVKLRELEQAYAEELSFLDSLDSSLFPCTAIIPSFSLSSLRHIRMPSFSTLLGIICFIPYTYLIGFSILFAPSLLPHLPHPFPIPPPTDPIARFAHWQWCAVHHIFIALSIIPLSFLLFGLSIGVATLCVMGTASFVAWSAFDFSLADWAGSGGLGQCDMLSVWVAVRGMDGLGVRKDIDGGWSLVKQMKDDEDEMIEESA